MKGGNNINIEDKDFRKSFELYDNNGSGFTSKNKTSRYLDVIIYTLYYIILSFWIQQNLILF